MAYAASINSVSSSPRNAVSAALDALRTAIERRRVYALTVRELSALSERDLHDLGIHQSMIAEIAREAAYGK